MDWLRLPIDRCGKRRPYVRQRGVLMTDEARRFGTSCTTEKRTVVDAQGNKQEVVFMKRETP